MGKKGKYMQSQQLQTQQTSEEVSTLIDVQNIEKSRITLKTFTGGSLGVTGSLGKLNYKIPKSKPWDRIDLELR